MKRYYYVHDAEIYAAEYEAGYYSDEWLAARECFLSVSEAKQNAVNKSLLEIQKANASIERHSAIIRDIEFAQVRMDYVNEKV